MRCAVRRVRAVFALAAGLLLAVPALAAASGLLVTAESSSSGLFITTAPLGPTFSVGTLAWPATSGASLQSVISRDGTVAFITQPGAGGQVASYERDPGTGALGAQISAQLTQGSQAGYLALTPDGSRLYTLTFDGTRSWVDEFDVAAGGALTSPGRTVFFGGSPGGLVISPDGRRLYVASHGSPSDILRFDVLPGGLQFVGTTGTGDNFIGGLLFTGDGSRLHAFYPDGNGAAAVSYSVDPATGDLTPLAPLPASSGFGGPQNSVLMGDGTTVVQSSLGQLHTWQVGSGGSLGSRSPAVSLGGLYWAHGLAAATGGGRVFVVGTDSTSLAGRAWSGAVTGGSLQAVSAESAFPSTAEYLAVSVGPAQPPVAAASTAVGEAGTPVVLDASASASPDPLGGPITRYDWDFGDGTSLADGGPTPAHTYSAPGLYTTTVTVTNAAGCSLGDGVWAGRMYACAGGPSARASSTVSVAAPAPAPTPAPTPLPVSSPAPAAVPGPSSGAGQGLTPQAPLTPAARARAAFSTAVGKARAARTKALAACARRPATARAACRRAAARRYTRTVALATAVRRRDLALARCAAKRGSAKARCTRAAKVRYARDRARARR